MAKHSKRCCGKTFRNESALNQHAKAMHPGRSVKAEKPARKGIWRLFFVPYFAVIAGMLTVQAFNTYGGPVIAEATAQAGLMKAVHVTRR